MVVVFLLIFRFAGFVGPLPNTARFGFSGIISAKVSLLFNRAEVVFEEDKITAVQIVEEIESIGFEAKYGRQIVGICVSTSDPLL